MKQLRQTWKKVKKESNMNNEYSVDIVFETKKESKRIKKKKKSKIKVILGIVLTILVLLGTIIIVRLV